MAYKISAAVPQLPSLDFERSKHFYERELGCVIEQEYDDLLILFLDEIEIHLWKCDNKTVAESSSCYFRVSDIEELYEKYKTLKQVVLPLQMRPCGIKEFYIRDDSGNLLKFGQQVRPL